MNESTDYLGLSKHKLFVNLSASQPRTSIKTQNVLTVNDGVLYTWDFQDNCVLTLNLKTSRCIGENLPNHQVLLMATAAHFSVEMLRANTTNTLLAVAGPGGVLVLELPERCPPHGSFANNKEMVYCRSHSLDEQLLTCHQSIEVRQVRFHPASEANTHILVLTSDNALRLYKIENGSALSVKVCNVGQTPTGVMPGTKSFFLGLLGDTAVDFDFGPPELLYEPIEEAINPYSAFELSSKMESTSVKSTKNYDNELVWPIYVLDGNGVVYFCSINIYNDKPSVVKGPLPIWPYFGNKATNTSCSILCLQSNPPILSIATINGTLFHSIVVPVDKDDAKMKTFHCENEFSQPADRALYILEALELELGLATSDALSDYCCPIFLHANVARPNNYFATHETGVHSIAVPALDALQRFLNTSDDENLANLIINQSSTVDYLICTKTVPSIDVNPVIGFGIYQDPLSIITFLANGQIVSKLTYSLTSMATDNSSLKTEDGNLNSPLKKMLSEPFDAHINRILNQITSQPILKLSSSGNGGNKTPQECYELLERAALVFRNDYFKQHTLAAEEIEKRFKLIKTLKLYQVNQLECLKLEKQGLQEKAECLAEKYEDIKDRHENIKKRCERLLIQVAQKKEEPTEAEKKFLEDLKGTQAKAEKYAAGITKLKNQIMYQQTQMENWRKEQSNNEKGLGSIQSQALRKNLQDMTNQITSTMSEVNYFKKKLALN